jgi:hypothetical protein
LIFTYENVNNFVSPKGFNVQKKKFVFITLERAKSYNHES